MNKDKIIAISKFIVLIITISFTTVFFSKTVNALCIGDVTCTKNIDHQRCTSASCNSGGTDCIDSFDCTIAGDLCDQNCSIPTSYLENCTYSDYNTCTVQNSTVCPSGWTQDVPCGSGGGGGGPTPTPTAPPPTGYDYCYHCSTPSGGFCIGPTQVASGTCATNCDSCGSQTTISCSLSLSPGSINNLVNPTTGVTATVLSQTNGTVSDIKFSTSNTSIATVSPSSDNSSPYTSTVTTKSKGSTSLIATGVMGGVDRCSTTIPINVFENEAPDCSNFTGSATSVSAGTSVTFTVKIVDTGLNLLTNSDFETSDTSVGWTPSPDILAWNRINANTWPSPGSGGNYYTALTGYDDGVSPHDRHVISDWVETGSNVTGEQFTLEFRKNNHGNPSAPDPQLINFGIQREPSGAFIGTDSLWSSTNFNRGYWEINVNDFGAFTTPTNSNTSSRIRAVIRPPGTNSWPVYYDDIKLYRTNTSGLDFSTLKFHYKNDINPACDAPTWVQFGNPTNITSLGNDWYQVTLDTTAMVNGDYYITVLGHDTDGNKMTGNPGGLCGSTYFNVARENCNTNLTITSTPPPPPICDSQCVITGNPLTDACTLENSSWSCTYIAPGDNRCRLTANPTSNSCTGGSTPICDSICTPTGNPATDACTIENSSWTCYTVSAGNNRCRLTSNPTSNSCNSTPPTGCNQPCTSDAQCSILNPDWKCSVSYGNVCRNRIDLSATDCLPVVGVPLECNESCSQVGVDACTTANSSWECYAGAGDRCRLSSNLSSNTCTPAGGLLNCNDTCSQVGVDQCTASNSSWSCQTVSPGNDRCRLTSNPTSNSCIPSGGLPICNQDCSADPTSCAAANPLWYCASVINKCRLISNPSSNVCAAGACTVSCSEDCGGSGTTGETPAKVTGVNMPGMVSGNKKDLTSSSSVPVTINWTAPSIQPPSTIGGYDVWIYPRRTNALSTCLASNNCYVVPGTATSTATTATYTPQWKQTDQVSIFVRARNNTCSVFGPWSDALDINYVADVTGDFYIDDAANQSGNTCIPSGGGTLIDLNANGHPLSTITADSNTINALTSNYSYLDAPYAPNTNWANSNYDIKLYIDNPVPANTLTCVCPAGCLYSGITTPNLTATNFYMTSVDLSHGAWWQSMGGNVYGANSLGTDIPNTCIVSDGCSPVIVTNNLTNNTDSAGIPITGSSTINSNGYYTEHSTDAKSVDTSHPNITREDYAFFSSEVDLTTATVITSDIDDTDFSNMISNSDEIYISNGDLTIDLTSTHIVPNSRSMTIFVDGNLTFDSNIDTRLTTVENGGFLAFIVSGDIIFDPNVGNDVSYGETSYSNLNENIAGVFVADGTIYLNGYSDSPYNDHALKDNKFTGEGTFVGWSGIELKRDFDNSSNALDKGINNLNPIEVFIFRPDFVQNIPEFMSRPSLVWQEVN